MKKHRLYIETRGFIMLCVNTVITFALLVCALLEHTGKHIPVNIFPILAVAGIADCIAAYLWVIMPYIASKKALALFASGYSFEGLFDKAHPLSLEMEKAQEKLTAMLKSATSLTISKRQAQFIALQNQINPHFLYNTLEGIRSEALSAGLTSVANISEALSLFFRYTISQMESLVTLDMELENTRGYFLIQQYRFGTRLHLDIVFDGDIAESAACCKLPKLTLQPIVENAIVHGIADAPGDRHLVIKIALTDERLLITVSDDGAGMDEGTLSRLQEKLSTNLLDDTAENISAAETRQGVTRGGIALRNVNKRIKILFGEEYGITVESIALSGTDVHISLPRKTDALPRKSAHTEEHEVRHEVLRLENVTASGLLNGLSFEVLSGEICGLVTVDYSGLDRLIELLTMTVTKTGNEMPDYGRIILHGNGSIHPTFRRALTNHGNVRQSASNNGGVFLIQGGSPLQLIDEMTIFDNICAVRSDSPLLLNRKAMIKEANQLLDRFGLMEYTGQSDTTVTATAVAATTASAAAPVITASTFVRDLSAYQKTILALAKAYVLHSPLVILDNITQFLTMDDTERVMTVVRELSVDGVSFLYICNHHQETFRYCDKTLFMKGGRIIKRLDRHEINALISAGNDAVNMEKYFGAPYDWAHSDEHKRLVSQNQIRSPLLRQQEQNYGFWCSVGELTLSMQKGETVLLLDNDGHTMQELMRLLQGGSATVDARDTAYVDGVPWSLDSRKGVLLPPEPDKRMLFPQMPLLDNLCFTLDGKLPHFWLTGKARKAVAHDVRAVFGEAVDAPSLFDLDDATLYRIVYQRVLIQHPSFVCAVQPLSSCDMMTRLMILKYLDAFRERGITTLLAAFAASDLLEVADRLIVVERGGKTHKEYTRQEFSSFNGVSGLVPEG